MTDYEKVHPPPVSAVPRFDADPIRLCDIELKSRRVIMRYAECGSSDGPAVVFCHGFPEIGYSWSKQMQPLAAAGYRTLAPDLRGFGYTKLLSQSQTQSGSAAAPKASDYTHREVCTDLDAFLSALHIPSAVFIGHDWGGAIVWSMARRFPKRVSAVGSVCTPFRPRSAKYNSPADIARAYPSMFYQTYFMESGGSIAAKELEADIEHTIRCFFRTSKPADKLPQKWMTAESRARGSGLFNEVPKSIARSELLTADEFAVFVDSYRNSKFHSALQWYCAHRENWDDESHLPQHITQPALMVTAGRDGVLLPLLTREMEEWCPLLTRAHIINAGHWVQFEQPTELSAVLLKWLASLQPQATRAAQAVKTSAANAAAQARTSAAAAAAAAASAGSGGSKHAKPILSKL